MADMDITRETIIDMVWATKAKMSCHQHAQLLYDE